MKNALKLLLFFLLLLHSCSEKPWLSGTVDYVVSEDWKPTIYLVQPVKFDDVARSFVGKILDSAHIDQSGHFEFKNLPEFQNQQILELVVQKRGEKYPNRLLNEDPYTANYFPFVYQPGNRMMIKANVAHFQSSFSIQEPLPENESILRLRDLRLEAYKKYLENINEGAGADEDLLLREKNQYDYQKRFIDFATESDALLPAMVALRWASPEGDYERIADLLYDMSQMWYGLYPEHPWVLELKAKADKKNLPILIGDIIPEMQLPIREGKATSLYSILKDQKLTLLDVWASWCAPCRLENRNVLVPLWEKYHGQDFQIIAYGLESSEKAWNNAIEKDGAYRWLHASHLQGDQNPFMDSLRLHVIPANYLLDADGKVLAKNLHGKYLVDFVNDHMENRGFRTK